MPAHPDPAGPEHGRESVGTFVKPGPDGAPVERTAWSPSEAVALAFDGWRPKPTTPEAPSPESTAPDDAGPPRDARRSVPSTKSR